MLIQCIKLEAYTAYIHNALTCVSAGKVYYLPMELNIEEICENQITIRIQFSICK